MPDGAGNPQSVRYLNRAGRPSDPAWNTGAYTFAGWSEDVSETTYTLYNFNTLIVSNKTLYAKWTPVTYTVTLECMNDEYGQTGSWVNSAQSITVANIPWNALIPPQTPVIGEGEQAFTSETNTPSRLGYTFAGWHTAVTGGTTWDMSVSTVTQSRTLYARWTAKTYTVTFYKGVDAAQEASVSDSVMPDPQPVRHLNRVFRPDSPTRTGGYAFAGWAVGSPSGDLYDFSILLTGTLNLYAKWNAVTYTVTLECMNDVYGQDGALQTSAQTITVSGISWDTVIPDQSGGLAPGNVPAKAGYTFNGWTTALVGGTSWTMALRRVTSNITLYARWTANIYTVTFNKGTTATVDNMPYPPDQSVQHLNRAYPPDILPTRAGYGFAGWGTSSDESNMALYSFGTLVTGDKTLYAKWTQNTYTVTFNAMNEISSPYSPSLVHTLTGIPENALLTGYTIAGLEGAGKIPAKVGYTFQGWWKGPNLTTGAYYDVETAGVTESMVLYGKWTAGATYTVTFNPNGESAAGMPPNQNVVYPGYAVSPAQIPTTGGKFFVGWYTTTQGHTEFDFTGTLITGATSVYAKWVDTVTVTFDKNGEQPTAGSWPANQTVPYQGYATGPATTGIKVGTSNISWNYAAQQQPPTGIAKVLTGWYTTPQCTQLFNFSEAQITGPTTIYAGWGREYYPVILHALNGTGGDLPHSYGRFVPANLSILTAGGVSGLDHGFDLQLRPTPQLAGHTFLGWWNGTGPDDPNAEYFDVRTAPVTQALTLYARWASGATYTVTFSKNGQDDAAPWPSNQTLEYSGYAAAPAVVPTTSANKIFTGWYAFNSPGPGTAQFDFGAIPITDNRTIYAGWRDAFTVTLLNPWTGETVERQVLSGQFKTAGDSQLAATVAEWADAAAAPQANYGIVNPNWYGRVTISSNLEGWHLPGTPDTLVQLPLTVNQNITLVAKFRNRNPSLGCLVRYHIPQADGISSHIHVSPWVQTNVVWADHFWLLMSSALSGYEPQRTTDEPPFNGTVKIEVNETYANNPANRWFWHSNTASYATLNAPAVRFHVYFHQAGEVPAWDSNVWRLGSSQGPVYEFTDTITGNETVLDLYLVGP
jgi:uncharacterized repeat protein (TIGR02543 family)